MLYSQGSVYSFDAVQSGDVCVVVPEEEVAGGQWRVSNIANSAVWVQGAP